MPEPSPHPERPHLPVLPVVLGLGPALLGATTAWVGARTPLAAAVLWAEPFLLFVGLYIAGWLLLDRRWLAAAATMVGFIAGGLIQRVPPVAQPPDPAAESWASELRGCSILPEAVKRPVRVLTWTLDSDGPTPGVASLLKQEADIAVLVGLRDPVVAEALAAGINGEALYLPAAQREDGMALVVRGVFQYCSGREDSWEVHLPGAEGEEARAVLTFPEVQGAGVVPLLAVQLSGPGEARSWGSWPTQISDSAQIIGSLSHALGPRRVVVAGDFGVPRTFRETAAPLMGAGLAEVPVPASWPTRLGPVDLPGLHALDRVWTGGAWNALAAHRTRSPRGHSRSPIVVDLAPAEAHAR